MIDHVSIPVRDLPQSAAFYEAVLSKIGFTKLVERPGTVGLGKKYPEFWLNHRPETDGRDISDGFHVCLRARTTDQVQEFHKLAMKLGAKSDGEPGVSPQNLVECAIIDVSILRVRLATLMRHLFYALLATARSSLRSQRELAIENLALRQQLAILKRTTKRPRLTNADRAFWVALSRLWSDWQHALLLVKPETVIGWHRKGFRLYWTWKSRSRSGRPRIDAEIRTLVDRMARENTTWGAPRIHGELLMLGFNVSEATVSRYMPRRRKPPSQSWRTFLRNHANGLVSIDFFVVPTATFRILYVFLVLEHERRRIVHFNVTEGPSAQWIGQQLVNAFPYNSAPKYVIRDRDKIYGANFVRRVHAMGIEQVLTAPRSPWQNPYCERVIGTLRRDCLDHVIVVGEQHLRRILHQYLEYYHGSRTHLALDKDAPELRERESVDGGKVVALPMVGGLHHRYSRLAA